MSVGPVTEWQDVYIWLLLVVQDAQEGFADWFEHYHHARPVEPPSPGPSATFTEKVAYDHRIAAYHKDLDRWRAAMDHQTKVTWLTILSFAEI